MKIKTFCFQKNYMFMSKIHKMLFSNYGTGREDKKRG